jgi:UMF1 family MFS transporter
MGARSRHWLRRLGVDRPEARAWALYDWANSAVFTTIITAVFPIYWHQVAAADVPEELRTGRFSLATTLALVAVAVLAPFLGAVADRRAKKRALLGTFMTVGVIATAALFGVGEGDWRLGLALFFLINVGAAGANVFYDSLLPHVARPGEADRLSTTAYAAGYLGGGLLLALNLAWMTWPGAFGIDSGDPTLPPRLAFLSVAVWWTVFTLPLLRRVAEPPSIAAPVPGGAVRTLLRTLRELRRYPAACWMLVAFLVYNDGIVTVIRFAAIYGEERELHRGVMIGSILMVQFVGVPCALLFGRLADRVGAKRAILGALAVFTVIVLLAFAMSTEWHFVALAFLLALVMGGTQALSRSLFSSLIPAEKSGEFFALFAVGEKFAGVLGPFLFFVMTEATGESRWAILAVSVFFAAGAGLLTKVDVEAGREAVARRL